MGFRGSSYIREAFNKNYLNEIVLSFDKCLKDKIFGEFDGIVCRGTSGLLVGPTLAHLFDKKLMVIRKPNDGSHCDTIMEGHDDIRNFIIVDDFISSGRTIEQILNGIEAGKDQWSYPMYNPIFVGCYLWAHTYINVSKEKVFCSDTQRFNRTVKGKIIAQRHNKEYKLDCMNEDEYLK